MKNEIVQVIIFDFCSSLLFAFRLNRFNVYNSFKIQQRDS